MNSTQNNGRARQQRPWSRPTHPANAKMLAAALPAQVPLAGRDEAAQPRPVRKLERHELDAAAPEIT